MFNSVPSLTVAESSVKIVLHTIDKTLTTYQCGVVVYVCVVFISMRFARDYFTIKCE